MELLGSQGAESWKDTITRGDNGLASQYTSSVTAHTKPLSLPACHVPHLCWLYLYSFPPLPLCPLPLHSSILSPPSPVPPFWSSTLASAPPPAPPLLQTPSLQLCCCRLPCQFQDTPQTVTATQEICCECSQLLVCVCEVTRPCSTHRRRRTHLALQHALHPGALWLLWEHPKDAFFYLVSCMSPPDL